MFKFQYCFLAILLFCCFVNSTNYDWSPVDKILQDAIDDKAFPGCTVLIASEEGILHESGYGHFTYGVPPPQNPNTNPKTELSTIFDLASLSKVVSTTSCVMQFYQRGELDLHMPLIDSSLLGPEFDNNDKNKITSWNLLTHTAGFPPDPDPLYDSKDFGCPATSQYTPPEEFTCQSKIWDSLMKQTLQYKTGEKFVYSDLSMITMMQIVGKLAKDYGYITYDQLMGDCAVGNKEDSKELYQCYYEAYARNYVFQKMKMSETGFRPPKALWNRCAPCENDTWYRHEVLQGHVHDENCYAYGGISGHAGVFSKIEDLYLLMNKLMFTTENDPFINSTTVKHFVTIQDAAFSSRALGWDTNYNSIYTACGSLSKKETYCHTGFTGGSLCNDRVRKLIVILLTNRVYPTRKNLKVLAVRNKLATQVQQIFDNN
ncbi:d-alanyl-d-alanine carboxypeptidase-related [Anaeramoeba flamelloides]|uniref:D-alanyl-d-alanine carboxypeptidase-related n=1 Tax=Anaeramoeba flamelloides TaxID=1746091 RepID=A0AAV8A392_9EUKA|nr:d-alanyl-d-alanine carboxypeptidase-related [Anaeramoeba flamelloides]